jgi:hypothetical protein
MTRRNAASLIALLVALAGSSFLRAQAPPDISGKWNASFETQIGEQHYTYDLVVKNGAVTGKAKSNIGEATIQDGKVEGDKVTFVEMLKFADMELRIDYTGKIVSADEIRFTRRVGDVATEELVAKRAK